ncbi:S8 family serine peptidase [Streptomyces marinisediminis]|nr:S8 family serine peptidase [Streptomyces sp. JHD 1]MCX2967585.1 S8 family serine peptidase [Streptomyces sp. JHD 1]
MAEEMWDVSTGEGITVAVIDTGVNPSTTSLEGRVLPGTDASGLPGGPHDDYRGHGTSMAELIAGSGKDGTIKGLAPAVKILPIRMDLGNDIIYNETADAIRAAADSEADIINMSFGAPGAESVAEAVTYAAGKGKLMFAGSGNHGEEREGVGFPAAFPEVVSVAALNRENEAPNFSGSGKVDMAAPGTDIPGWCDETFTDYCTLSGTSDASAIASAAAALIWAEHPEWTANQVLRVMLETAGKPVDGEVSTRVGHGAIRPRAVLLEGKGNPGDPDQHPLLKPAESAAPGEPGESGGTGEAGGPSDEDGDAADTVTVADPGGEGGVPVGLLVGAGVALAVVVAGGVTFAVRRRS